MRIRVKVILRANRNEIIKISEGEYKIRLAALPVKGKANERLFKILADYFKVSKSLVSIISGKNSREKIINIL